MHILSILLFCFSANLDTFLIGLACSLGGGSFPVKKNLLLSSVCTAGTALAMLSGRLIGEILTFHTSNLIGGILLLLLGAWFTLSGIRSVFPAARTEASCRGTESFAGESGASKAATAAPQENGTVTDNDVSEYAGTKNTTAMTTSAELTEDEATPFQNTASVLPLAIALSLNNFALGLGASITGLPVFATSLATFASSFFLLLAGQWMGHTCLARFCGKYAGLFSGLIILILGLYEIFI